MPSHHQSVDAPRYAQVGAAQAFPVFLGLSEPCDCECVPTPSVVYQSKSGSGVIRGIPHEGKYYRRREYNASDGDSVKIDLPGSWSMGCCYNTDPDDKYTYTFSTLDSSIRVLINDRDSEIAATDAAKEAEVSYHATLGGECYEGEASGLYYDHSENHFSYAPLFDGYLPGNVAPIFSYIYFQRTLNCDRCNEDGDPCDGDLDYFTTPFYFHPPGGSEPEFNSYTDEFTLADAEGLADEDITAGSYLAIDSAHSVQRNFSAKVYKHRYVSTDYVFEGGNEVTPTATWELNETSFNSAVASRVSSAQSALNSAEATETVASGGYDNAVQALADAESELTSLESQLASEISELDSKRAQVNAKDHQIVAIKNQLAYATLTDAERSALEAQRDSLTDDANDIIASYPDVSSTQDSVVDARATVRQRTATVASASDTLTIASANVTQLTARLAACQANENAQWFQYSASPGSSAFNTQSETNVSKRVMRYRVKINLQGYALAGSTSFTLNWRERTYQHDNREPDVAARDTYTYVARSAIVTASPGDLEASTDWFSVSAPSADHTVAVVGVAIASSAYLTVQHQGAEAEKRGIYGYTPSTPPRIYRRENVTGGWSGDPSTDYTSERYYAEDPENEVYEFSDDFTTANKLENWPKGTIFQPATDDVPTGRRPATPTTESATARSFSRVRGGLVEDIDFSLSEEYTTVALKAEVDDRIGGTWPDGYQAFTLPAEIGSSLPASIRHLSADERHYSRSRFRYKVTGSLPSAPTESMAPQTETFELTRYTLNLSTGVLSSVASSVQLVFDEGETNKQQDDWTTVEAAEDELVWIELGSGNERNHYEGLIELIPPTPASYGEV